MKRQILAGGGHAHLHVLKALAAHHWPDIEVILISPYSRQIYSGMVPGWMAGHYTLDQCAAALTPLASMAGVRFIQDTVTGIDAMQRLVHTAQSGDIPYDALSLDTGARVDASCLAATDARLLPIRPLENFVLGWSEQLNTFKAQGTASLAVIGGGAAGVELALAARYRLAAELGEKQATVHLVVGSALMPGHGQGIVRRVRKTLDQQGVKVIDGYAAGSANGVELADGRQINVDCIIASTGVQPALWLATSGLALSDDGFIAVTDGQQSASHPEVFAAGDVATRIDAPHAKSGVYAVRAGPVLTENLRRVLDGQSPAPYQPQKRSLYLLATGPQHAIMSWGSASASGHWAWRWKDWIDRRFMKQYDLNPTSHLGEKNESN
jgi:pyridine nucleotide-disulfide oxidoreductase family protein